MKYIFLFASIMTSLMNSQAQNTQLIYVGDPMCSWCYGFSSELDKVVASLDETVGFQVVMGGLRPYNTETMTELKTFLTHHWEDVHAASGVPFNYGILDRDGITYDTEPPSRAVCIVRDHFPDKTYAFFKLTQKAFYFENNNMHLVDSYTDALKSLNIDEAWFVEQFNSDEYKAYVKQDFQLSQSLGVRGFPALVLKHNGEYHRIASGYTKSDIIVQNIAKVLHP